MRFKIENCHKRQPLPAIPVLRYRSFRKENSTNSSKVKKGLSRNLKTSKTPLNPCPMTLSSFTKNKNKPSKINCRKRKKNSDLLKSSNNNTFMSWRRKRRKPMFKNNLSSWKSKNLKKLFPSTKGILKSTKGKMRNLKFKNDKVSVKSITSVGTQSTSLTLGQTTLQSDQASKRPCRFWTWASLHQSGEKMARAGREGLSARWEKSTWEGTSRGWLRARRTVRSRTARRTVRRRLGTRRTLTRF